MYEWFSFPVFDEFGKLHDTWYNLEHSIGSPHWYYSIQYSNTELTEIYVLYLSTYRFVNPLASVADQEKSVHPELPFRQVDELHQRVHV